MKAEELRIGNLVFDAFGDIKKCDLIMIGNIGLMKLKPIPLTEERKRELGFDGDNVIHLGIGTQAHELQITKQGDVLIYDMEGEFINLGEVEYVHEAQNLFHSLTGKELELKNT